MPVYELTATGHSTHMYGALVPWVQGEIFRWVGPNNISGRVLTRCRRCATVTLLAVTMRGRRSAWYLAVAWVMILGVNHRAGQYLPRTGPTCGPDVREPSPSSPDGIRPGTKRVVHGSSLGSACLVVGFFFKQTVSIFRGRPRSP